MHCSATKQTLILASGDGLQAASWTTCTFIRFIQKSLNKIIPNKIQLIIAKYLINYLIFAVGGNQDGEFGLDHQKKVDTWTQLIDLEDLVSSVNDLYVSGSNIMVITSNAQLYVAGDNKIGQIGLNKHWITIK